MAAGSDLLDEVFLNTEVDEKVVSDLVGSLESQLAASGHHHQHHKAQEPLRAAGGLLGNHVVSSSSSSSSPSPSPGGVVVGGNANAQTESSSSSKMGLSAPEITKAGAGGVQGGVINHNTRSQTSALDGATTTSTSTTTAAAGGSEVTAAPGTLSQGKSVVISTMATALSTRNGKIGTTTVQTLNGSNVVMNSHHTGSAAFSGTPVTANPASAPAVAPLVNNGPGSVGKGNTVNAVLPSASNTVIQTSFLNTAVSSASSSSPTVISSQPPPSIGTGAPTAPGTPIIARQVTPTTIIKQVSQAQTTVQPTTTLQRPPVVQPQIVLGGTAQTTTLGTATAVQTGTPQRTVQGTTATSTAATETMENVKKCKNFLSTLIKLASSGKQSSETAANVKELVQNLLDGKIEAEDFTSRLYRELNSSPQPYLVPFLKRSLPALRQLTPDSAAFIQQSQQQQPTTQATIATIPSAAVLLSSSVQRTAGKATATVTSTLQQPVISLTQPTQVGVSKQGQSTPLVIQQSQKAGALIRPPQVTLTQTPMVALRQPHSRIMLTTPQIQLNQLQTVPVVKPAVLPGNKAIATVSTQVAAAQKNKLKEPGGGSFRDDDDINDVASMAGVNLSEESARILATNSELVGTLTRSCKDETFLFPAPLQRRILEIGKKHGITEIHPDVVSYVSHATQQRLQNLVEKLSETAQQKNISYKDDERYEQASDVRAQLKFFEQLDQIEKQRKDEQEREILMRAAKASAWILHTCSRKSRSRQEDPEQLRLKQKAKEMQQQELAQMRQRDANLTALAAIGPRKKRKVDSPGSGSGTEGSGSSAAVPGSSGVGTTRQFTRQRITRVNLRDLIFCLENERETSHSLLLYKAFLK
ncbi:hypothetical protein QYF61_011488 [Mycteria americana]|uniref:TAFH domain-containing protein n=1 Tax=Mycteria americana TaxID=33587 RepID=A0AAN7NC17_MYCAM|nr:hypothetical protein QYF61_011488 [Mycteria americana]